MEFKIVVVNGNFAVQSIVIYSHESSGIARTLIGKQVFIYPLYPNEFVSIRYFFVHFFPPIIAR